MTERHNYFILEFENDYSITTRAKSGHDRYVGYPLVDKPLITLDPTGKHLFIYVYQHVIFYITLTNQHKLLEVARRIPRHSQVMAMLATSSCLYMFSNKTVTFLKYGLWEPTIIRLDNIINRNLSMTLIGKDEETVLCCSDTHSFVISSGHCILSSPAPSFIHSLVQRVPSRTIRDEATFFGVNQTGEVLHLNVSSTRITYDVCYEGIVGSDLTMLTPSLLFLASKFNDSKLLKIGSKVEELMTFENFGPVTGLQRLPNGSILAACNTFNGSLRSIRTGPTVDLVDEIELKNKAMKSHLVDLKSIEKKKLVKNMETGAEDTMQTTLKNTGVAVNDFIGVIFSGIEGNQLVKLSQNQENPSTSTPTITYIDNLELPEEIIHTAHKDGLMITTRGLYMLDEGYVVDLGSVENFKDSCDEMYVVGGVFHKNVWCMYTVAGTILYGQGDTIDKTIEFGSSISSLTIIDDRLIFADFIHDIYEIEMYGDDTMVKAMEDLDCRKDRICLLMKTIDDSMFITYNSDNTITLYENMKISREFTNVSHIFEILMYKKNYVIVLGIDSYLINISGKTMFQLSLPSCYDGFFTPFNDYLSTIEQNHLNITRIRLSKKVNFHANHFDATPNPICTYKTVNGDFQTIIGFVHFNKGHIIGGTLRLIDSATLLQQFEVNLPSNHVPMCLTKSKAFGFDILIVGCGLLNDNSGSLHIYWIGDSSFNLLLSKTLKEVPAQLLTHENRIIVLTSGHADQFILKGTPEYPRLSVIETTSTVRQPQDYSLIDNRLFISDLLGGVTALDFLESGELTPSLKGRNPQFSTAILAVSKDSCFVCGGGNLAFLKEQKADSYLHFLTCFYTGDSINVLLKGGLSQEFQTDIQITKDFSFMPQFIMTGQSGAFFCYKSLSPQLYSLLEKLEKKILELKPLPGEVDIEQARSYVNLDSNMEIERINCIDGGVIESFLLLDSTLQEIISVALGYNRKSLVNYISELSNIY
eukprot:TRINITY_DN3256_c1_g1_i1.p1 TRINITY_DN3256_c1_g1~~TRINITY_DN3256_c1_g1_i1.p1  ORF type:complete len:1089 (-),score=235.57 TRINITY_DN3256_c1_g1_i1:3502-6450(-)